LILTLEQGNSSRMLQDLDLRVVNQFIIIEVLSDTLIHWNL